MRAARSAMVTPTWVEPVKLDAVDVGRVDQGGRGGGAAAVHQVDHTRREADFMEDAHEFDHGQWVLRGRLDHDRVAGGEGGRHLARHVDHREVVRRDAGHHTDRLPVDHAADDAARGEGSGLGGLGQERRLQHRTGVAGVALEAVGRHRHLHPRSDGGGRTGLGDHQGQELIGLGPDGARRPRA